MSPSPRLSTDRRVWAVIPAAGLSRRMGQHKLLLDIRGRPLIERIVDAFDAVPVSGIHLLVREDDLPLRRVLETLPANVHVIPHTTVDMRASVQQLLDRLVALCDPHPEDAWLLAPADHPVLSPDVVSTLIAASAERPDAIHVPVCDGRRGHPTLFPWRCIHDVRDIPDGHGLNWLLRQCTSTIVEVPVDDPGILVSLNTPEDYARLLGDPGTSGA